ncbi:hypothetical protein [Aequorivita antarctica]|uniref:hypothetical protein n=1 Tax=Aequorivita antarctica TaxID=153266 RepID=UPI000DBBD946|nr:hypothetical protein [Aequorivita antarctica]SRX75642.1 hypothetical protein AEQU3_02638 [Aequorivita antarctica]
MDLKDFIKQTLIQITDGVKDAQEYIKDSGAYINPEGFHDGENLKSGYRGEYRHVQKVKLSVAVNVVENSELKGGVGIISVFSAGVSSKVSDVNTIKNRIEFEIPISLPVMDIEK